MHLKVVDLSSPLNTIYVFYEMTERKKIYRALKFQRNIIIISKHNTKHSEYRNGVRNPTIHTYM